jgi:hypothetical protein
MKSFQFILLAVIIAVATAFTPATVHSSPAKVSTFKSTPLAAVPSKTQEVSQQNNKNAAALAAFATAIAPFAANAADIDEGTIIGYGAGLVACVVSLAVGFAIGYGTLVKP